MTVRNAVEAAWSIETAVQWTPEIPAGGQCNVTTVLIHDIYGGQILKTALPEVDHYYNEINGMRVDFTDSQFAEPIRYDDTPADRAEAMKCVTPKEYDVLRKNFFAQLGT
ncbi:MAG: YunG family protein [Hyphomicrobiaceae bacterium]